MTTDDDQKLPEQDSWAELGHGGANEEAEENFAFAFDALDEEPSPPADPEAAPDIPLVVFPRPDDEVASADVLGDGERSDVISMAAMTAGPSADGFSEEVFTDEVVAGNDRAEGHTIDDAHDHVIDREQGLADLGLLDEEDDPVAADAVAANGSIEDSADFGEPSHDAVSDDVSFDAGIVSNETPFADGNQVDAWADAGELGQGDPASIPLTAAVAAVSAADAQPVPARKKRSGLGKMIGVGVGGLMALPITYAVMVWGLHQDPLGLGKQLPGQLAVLLPQKLQPGAKPPANPAVTPATAPGASAVPATEDLSTTGEEAAPAVDQPVATAAAESTDVEPVEPSEPAAETGETVETVAVSDPAVAPADTLETTVSPPPAVAEPVMLEPEPVSPPGLEADRLAVVDTITGEDPLAAATSATTLPPSDPLAGLDALVADVAVADVAAMAPPVSAVVAPVVPPLDQTGVELAAERASHAFEALEIISDPADPKRNRLSVEWYKSLAELGEQLVTLETKAAESGHSTWGAPAAATDLLGEISISEKAVADLDRLGRMWLASEKRRADGISLVATLAGARQVGPYWSTRGVVAGGNSDGTDRSISIISRLAPPTDPGNRVVVSGVLFDGNAIWAADMRPIPPTFEASEDAVFPVDDAPTP